MHAKHDPDFEAVDNNKVVSGLGQDDSTRHTAMIALEASLR